MSIINAFMREIGVKVVYYGPGLGGKTSSLQYIHRALKVHSRGQLVSLATGVDRTLYFDFLPLRLPKLHGFSIRMQLYTVPGQVHYNSTRKLVLAGADGVVFVADSQQERLSSNLESFDNLEDNLNDQGLALTTTPLVLQYNKRDLPDPVPVEDLEAALNTLKVPAFETVATRGTGVLESLKAITALVLRDLRRKNLIRGTEEGKKKSSIPPRQSIPVPAVPAHTGFSVGSIGEMQGAMDSYVRPPSLRPASIPPAEGSLSELVRSGSPRTALLRMERELDAGNWNGVVSTASEAFHDHSRELAKSVPGESSQDIWALAALVSGIPAPRFVRFRQLQARARNGDKISSTDAVFTVFFIADFLMRVEELQR